MSKSVFESKKFKKFMTMTYGWGASIVILGALFKILHLKGADLMLMVGLITESIIFFISGFEPVHEDLDWSLVYPELAGMDGDDKKNKGTVSQQLDKMLSEARIGPELIEGLGTGLRSLTENVSQMADISEASVATKEYAANVQKAANSLSTMSGSYDRAIAALNGLSESGESYREMAGTILSVSKNLSDFDSNLTNLNKIYGNMLNAFRPS